MCDEFYGSFFGKCNPWSLTAYGKCVMYLNALCLLVIWPLESLRDKQNATAFCSVLSAVATMAALSGRQFQIIAHGFL
jgi:hypothetical protein